MAPDISVVIPIYNAGPNLQGCLASLRAQSLDRDRFEVVAVDDGSTDGTGERLDALAATSDGWLRVRHISASGWPGRPRNVGIETALGRYIQLMDCDDALGPTALERQLEVAVDSDADIVLGKLVTDFRSIDHPIFRHTLTHRTYADFPMVESLTPHKLFRRGFLLDHDIRFPEGHRYIEDAVFCVHAYLHARSVAVVGDTPCYFYQRRRDAGHHLSGTRFDPDFYYECVEDVLDVIDRHLDSPAERAVLSARFFRKEMLGRIRGAGMLRYDEEYRSATVAAVRRTATRFPPAVIDSLGGFIRPQAWLLEHGGDDDLLRFAQQMEQVRLVATVTDISWADGRLQLSVEAELRNADEPLRMTPHSDGWLVPDDLAVGAPPEWRVMTKPDIDAADVECTVTSRQDGTLWSTTAESLAIVAGVPRVSGRVIVDPALVAGGRRLAAGLWDLRLRVTVAGLSRSAGLRAADASDAPPGWVANEHSVQPYWTSATTPVLALDVDEWMHPLLERVTAATTPLPDLAGRRLRVPLPATLASPGTVRPVTVALAAEDSEPPVTAAGVLTESDGHLELRARLPKPPSPSRHQLRLAAGLPGTTPTITTGWTVQPSDSGLLQLTAAADD